MKFKCDQCGTRYSIADEKVHNRVLKIRCKICEYIITIQDPRATPTPAPATAPSVPSAPPEPLWYASTDRGQIGPVPLQQLQEMVKAGQVRADHHVRSTEMSEWSVVHTRVDLFPGVQPPAPVVPQRGTPVGRASLSQMGPGGAPAVGSLGSGADLMESPGGAAWDGPMEERTVVEEIPDELYDQQPKAPTPAPAGPRGSELSGLIDLGQLDALESGGAAPEPSRAPAPEDDKGVFMPMDTLPPLPDMSGLDLDEQDTVLSTPSVGATPSPIMATQDLAQTPELLLEARSLPAEAGKQPAPSTPPPAPTPEQRATPPGPPFGSVPTKDPSPAEVKPPEAAPAGGNKKTLLIVLALLLVVGVGVALALNSGGGSEDKADAAISAGSAADNGKPTNHTTANNAEQGGAPDAAVAAAPAKPDATVAAKPAVADAAVAAKLPEPRARDPKGPTAKGPVRKPTSDPTPRTIKNTAKNTAKKDPVAEQKSPAVNTGDDMMKKPEVRPSLPTASSESLPDTLSPQQIGAVMKRQRVGIRNCYNRHLKRDGSAIKTRTMLRFNIEATGSTNRIRLPRTLDDTTLKTCLVALISRIKFDRFKGDPIPVEYPLVFQTAQ